MSIPSDDMRGTQGKTTQDWTEDFNLENGRYQCLCIACGKMFYGHKRRSICKVCAAPVSSPSETEPSPASRSADALPSNIRRTLEESNLPIEVATAIADRLEARQPVGGDVGELVERMRELAGYKYQYHTVHVPAVLEKAAALIEKLEIERDEDRAVLMRHGFVRCDIPACNCGSWHPRFGLTERMQEIKDLLAEAGHELSNENGHLVKVALSELIAERDALKSRLDAPCEEGEGEGNG